MNETLHDVLGNQLCLEMFRIAIYEQTQGYEQMYVMYSAAKMLLLKNSPSQQHKTEIELELLTNVFSYTVNPVSK